VITLFLLAVGLVAGIVNSIVGGGQFLTFPAFVLAGTSAVIANTTSSVAVFPGIVASAFAYRSDLARLAQVINLKLVIGVSLVGALIGALLLTHTPESVFTSLAPWLLLFGTVIYALGNRVNDVLRRHMRLGTTGLLVVQFLIGIYGGYFGAGIGILMLALMGLFGIDDLHAISGLRTLLSSCINGVAVITFVIEGKVYWQGAAIVAVAALVGGYAGAAVARRLSPKILRPVIVVIAVTMTVYFFAR
jgi:uncharacterized membrane protein YfcA